MPNNKSAKGLGRGFDALIPQDFDQSLLIDEQDRVQKLLISDIKPAADQPRTEFDEQALDELAQSIKRHGVLQPLIVRPHDNGYIIVAGERRWRAAQKAGLNQVPAIVRSLAELEQLEIALIENVQREDLSPLDQAVSIQRLVSQFQLTLDDIAKRLGKAPSTVSNLARLTALPVAAQKALRAGTISEGHARAILALKQQPEKQQELLESIIKNHWTVRQAEAFVVATKKGAPSQTARQSTVSTTPQTKVLAKQLGVQVAIRRTAKGGRLELTFSNDQELENLIKRLQTD